MTVGLFHKLISVYDVRHNMLHLHVAQQLPSLEVHAPVSSNDKHAELSRQSSFDIF